MKLKIKSTLSNDKIIDEKTIDVNNGSVLVLKANNDDVTYEEAQKWFDNVVSVAEGFEKDNSDGVGVLFLPNHIDLMVLNIEDNNR